MKPRTFGVVVTDIGARLDFARHMPDESAGRFTRSSGQVARRVDFGPFRPMTFWLLRRVRAGPVGQQRRCVRRQPHAMKRNSTIASNGVAVGCPDCFFGQPGRLSSAPPRQHGSAANEKRDPRGRLLFTFLADLSGLGQTSSPPAQTLVVRQPQSPKLSPHCTCRGARLWSARVATFLLTRLPANLSSLISAFVTEGSRRFRKYVRR